METKEKSDSNAIDMTEVLKDFGNKWVILSRDYKKVLKSSDNPEDILDHSNLGIIMLVPDPNVVFMPKFLLK